MILTDVPSDKHALYPWKSISRNQVLLFCCVVLVSLSVFVFLQTLVRLVCEALGQAPRLAAWCHSDACELASDSLGLLYYISSCDSSALLTTATLSYVHYSPLVLNIWIQFRGLLSPFVPKLRLGTSVIQNTALLYLYATLSYSSHFVNHTIT